MTPPAMVAAGKTSKSRIQFVRQYPAILRGPAGEPFVARAYMDRQPGGLWEAYGPAITFYVGAGFSLAALVLVSLAPPGARAKFAGE